jgi:hypothetical protein
VILVLRSLDSDWDFHHRLPLFSGLGLGLDIYCQLSWASSMQIVGLLSLPNHVIQWLIINFFLYTVMCGLTGIWSEKCMRHFIVVQTCRTCYTNLDGIASAHLDCIIILEGHYHTCNLLLSKWCLIVSVHILLAQVLQEEQQIQALNALAY